MMKTLMLGFGKMQIVSSHCKHEVERGVKMIEIIEAEKIICICIKENTRCLYRDKEGMCTIPIEILLKENGDCPYRKYVNAGKIKILKKRQGDFNYVQEPRI